VKSLTVVVPVYNEIQCLPLFYQRAIRVAASMSGTDVRFLFVDDGSSDGSYKWLADLAARDRRVQVLRFSRNFGSYVALTAGLANAQGDAAVTLSADLQDPPEMIPELVAKWKEGYDVVWAARRSRTRDPLWRRIASSLFYSVFRRIAFRHYPPKGYDFCLVDRGVIDAVTQSQERNTSIFALIVWASFQSTAILYDRGPRAAGESHWNLRKMLKLASDAILSFSSLPVRFSLWCAVAVAIGLFGYLAFIVYGKVTGAYAFPPGWPSTMATVLVTSGLQLFVLAILGEYLWRALDQTRGRPMYVISRRLGFGEDPATARRAAEPGALRQQG
jgi:polyisoprenyl-phosphate glycosyltransferase